MRRLLIQTSAIQSLGVLFMLMTTLFVSRIGGADAQGSFALVKSFNDLQVALFSLGIPSAIVIVINRQNKSQNTICRMSTRYSLFLFLLLPALNLALLSWIYKRPLDRGICEQAVMLGWSSALFVAFAFYRALLLVFTDGPFFSVISILHWIFILLVALSLLNRSQLVFEIAYLVAGVASLAVLYPAVVRRLRELPAAEADQPIDWTLLRAQSANVAAQAILYGAQPFLTNAFLARHDPDLTSAGLFNIAALAITLPNLLVALIAPVLLNRWSKHLDWEGYASVRRYAFWMGGLVQLAALLAMPLIPWALKLVFGAEFVAATNPVRIIALASFAVIAVRVLTPAVQGLGDTHLITRSCLVRILCVVATTFVAHMVGCSLILAFAAGWATGEYGALAYIYLVARPSRADLN